jgi:uncharacterized protein YndB with AHSA1/START domain
MTSAADGAVIRGELMAAGEPFEHDGRVIRVEMRTTAPADRVWDAWADPERLSQWFADRVEGQARAGGTMTWIFERFGSRFPYDVVIAVPRTRLVLKGSPPGRRPFFLEILIGEEGPDTTLRILNSGFSTGEESDEEYEGVLSGWRMALAILREYLERHFGRPKSPFFAMQPASFTYDEILPWFHEAPLLYRWLTTAGGIDPTEGALYEVALRGGGRMSGRVLAVTSREIALGWEEIGGVVEMKAFKLGPLQRAVAVRGCGWTIQPARAAKIERSFAAAIDRLVAALSTPEPVH